MRMRKKLSKILIPIIALSIFLAPVSPIISKENGKITAKINQIQAQTNTEDAELKINGVANKNLATFRITLKDENYSYYTGSSLPLASVASGDESSGISLKLFKTKTKQESGTLSESILNIEKLPLQDWRVDATELESETEYVLLVDLQKLNMGSILGTLFFDVPIIATPGHQIVKLAFKTTSGGSNNILIDQSQTIAKTEDPPYTLACGITNLGGCIAQIVYFFWTVSSWIAELAGSFLDFFVYYSTNSDSYTSSFVTEGWKIIRNVSNIFFIIALLYIAIKIILGLDSTSSKKLIAMVILMALLINFSLFITQVVIDSSNILAKVFYNKITPINKNGNKIDANSSVEEKSISVGLIRGYNPQKIINGQQYYNNIGKFVFVTILLTALTLYTAYIFFIIAILFVGRVVSLWISMIFSPLAFISYAVPFLNISGFGYKKWWDNLFKAAFLAPIFIFFLYIIILFVELGADAINYANNSEDFMQNLMKTMIPFSIIFLLLMQAKKITIDLSGELGAALTKAGGMALGVAGGAVMGGAALLGTGVIGGAASRIAGSEWLKDQEKKKGLGGFAARMALK